MYPQPFYPVAPSPGLDDVENFEKLLSLAEKPDFGAIRCEICRYMGRFDEALAAVDTISGAPTGVIAFLRSLCVKRDTGVQYLAQSLLKP
ncbi:MAG TPA: hypothetical protein VMQ67_00060 [Candidatus Saccharimonadales bacterium]|nr:hypothetical protein [Candidatus Saccharimonadales bacterium]